MNESRKWLPSFSELIDRLSIHQLKELLIPKHKNKYRQEMRDMVHDLDVLIKENKIELTGELIHSIVLLSQMNAHIWYNESKVRSGQEQDLSLLKLTHGLNGIRNEVQNHILGLVKNENRMDYKTDCLAAEFKDWSCGLIHKD